jgi:hypothetical protein
MAGGDPQGFLASVARTTSSNSPAVALGDKGDQLCVLVAVTAVSGTTPSMTLTVEWSHDGTNFAASDTPDTFTAITTAVNRVKNFQVKGNYYRLVWAITGTTPSFTFTASSYVTT